MERRRRGRILHHQLLPLWRTASLLSPCAWPGKPLIAYSHNTWKLDSGLPMHSESGYWRPKHDGSVEVVIAQSTGLAEVLKGTHIAEDKVIKLQSQVVANASKLREISRVHEMVNGELHYVVQMATNLTALQPHLKAVLKKLP
ncbi:hypothetical protein V6N13_141283 [Hibiscus sabdariffa]|uniref:THAP4-like heme-binding domain-containing protein n=1 Tax=Hibiscus sabdariffa TaxID=183260 RepID=A0ABR2AU64_9ROSI